MTIVGYANFQCPFSREADQMLREEVLPAYPGKVRYAYKHLPLPVHDWSQAGALAWTVFAGKALPLRGCFMIGYSHNSGRCIWEV